MKSILPESFVHPRLSEVAVQGVDLVHLIHRTHGPNGQVDIDLHWTSTIVWSHPSVVAGLEQEIVQSFGGLLAQRGSTSVEGSSGSLQYLSFHFRQFIFPNHHHSLVITEVFDDSHNTIPCVVIIRNIKTFCLC